ncbi:MAG TPA: (2Fe-2S) ferredoxin domain-containing protein [Accumulibacter sp.]|uniref:(2Fe-2S) ferredoxin domain-containing protein n=1 Tax=Accumulibacter sp. TaxID=2053492 RepID=UPI000ED00E5C|nr:(2Fe-2S) ferredoxin domain-containing protein [Accumulibacter sp.]HCZ17262.1 2Fe-2S ferredoxin [Accumulibacter sp.]HRD93569.1 (2Fe-2S) ferredoxin domain-containing protein [Accumulibacter sp.]HRF72780.1 (2Fe-2S) ferredoxin domain-containing protein [Accumulibacter sp.]
MSYFKHHVFFCCNQRGPGETCCNNSGATAAQTYAKDRIGELKLKGVGKVRINKAGCMDRCDSGPVLVVYPEAVWYSYVDSEDIEEIIQEHLVHGRVVDRLRI